MISRRLLLRHASKVIALFELSSMEKSLKYLEEKRKLSNEETNYHEEEEEQQFISRINQRYHENVSSIKITEVTDSNVAEYDRLANQGISEEDIQKCVEMRANRLLMYWEQVIEELKKLQQSLKGELDKRYDVSKINEYSDEEKLLFSVIIGCMVNAGNYVKGVSMSIINLKGNNHYNRCLAIVSSSARRDLICKLLTYLAEHNVNIDTEQLKVLIDRIKFVLGSVPDNNF